ncbi:VOC family protein [Microbulbifer sp. OS29]|uniref:VOC family protein n=1 Tax=Microbulbifer okhotskensis TaxID=2926617 RepID=A0A9X2ERF9_9GAMM|nr:VOC family protein [Microbulbifer okhotskensis]MCO1336035.1 VOC family protein [Microbulbifer okhotskensis]
MYSHIMVGANEIEVSRAFYDATFKALGYKTGVLDDKGRYFYFNDTGTFAISKPIDGEPACHGNGSTIGFNVSSPEEADAWHAAGIANGGTSCEEPPGIRESVIGPIYLAYLRDPAGNKLCALHKVK